MDLVDTLLVSVLGGTIGSTVTAIVSLRIYKQQERAHAYNALWDYHYALTGFAQYSAPKPDDEINLLKSDLSDVRTALRRAYPYARYIRKPQRDKLLNKAYVSIDAYTESAFDQDESIYTEFNLMSELLKKEIEIAFPSSFIGSIISKIRQLG